MRSRLVRFLPWVFAGLALGCGGGSRAGDPGGNPDFTVVDPAWELADAPMEVVIPTDLGTESEEFAPADTPVPRDSLETLDESTAETGPECPGSAGCDCQKNEDCDSGWCLSTLEGRRCTSVCVGEDSCPQGWACVPVGVPGSDLTYVCADPHPTLCRPCKTSQDCQPSVPVSTVSYTCVEFGPQGRFCETSCTDSAGCPKGYECAVTGTGRAKGLHCRPAGGVDCDCTWLAKEQGAKTVCSISNDFGTCFGDRACDEACPAPMPAVESCNAKDDDCDGTTDEDVAPHACDLTNEFGTCQGQTLCAAGGKEVCEGQAATLESCDGLDNDCDGQTDEADALGCKPHFKDGDGDAYGVTGDMLCLCQGSPPYTATEGGDCDDAEPLAHPGLAEICDGRDNDCNGVKDDPGLPGCVDYFRDDDGDGFGNAGDSQCLCGPQAPWSAVSAGDCDDAEPLVHPEVPEACNGRDDDCDGVTDGEGASGCTQWYRDDDGDGAGVTPDSKCLCGPAAPYTASVGGDCDDADATVLGGAPETCNGRDDNCDGATDEAGAVGCTTWFADVDGDGFGVAADSNCLCGPASPYTAAWAGDCDDAEPGSHPGAVEVCDGRDNDCNGETDEGLEPLSCGLGACVVTVPGCVDGKPQTCVPGTPGVETCNGLDDDCDGATDEDLGSTTCGSGACSTTVDNCKDGQPRTCVPPGPGLETCDGTDDDCDGLTDEEGAIGCKWYYEDHDGDEYGAGDTGRCLCAPTGFFTTLSGNDCDDANILIHPGAGEACNGVDEDCDGLTDPPDSSGCLPFGYDQDGDGYRDPSKPEKCLCEAAGFYRGTLGTDCDDADPDSYPGANEVCDGHDNDCDGATDEGLGTTTCGAGACVATVDNCKDGKPVACVPRPPGTETCDGADDDCDGLTDEEDAIGCKRYYEDRDGDDYGIGTTGRCLCAPSALFTAPSPGDCDDANILIHPGVVEACNGVDEDCDGLTDPANSTGCLPFGYDQDGDGYRDPAKPVKCLCAATGFYRGTLGPDCDDADPASNPGAAEICGNGKDEDCDGVADDGCVVVGVVQTFAAASYTGPSGVVKVRGAVGQPGPVGEFVPGAGSGPSLCLGTFCLVKPK